MMCKNGFLFPSLTHLSGHFHSVHLVAMALGQRKEKRPFAPPAKGFRCPLYMWPSCGTHSFFFPPLVPALNLLSLSEDDIISHLLCSVYAALIFLDDAFLKKLQITQKGNVIFSLFLLFSRFSRRQMRVRRRFLIIEVEGSQCVLPRGGDQVLQHLLPRSGSLKSFNALLAGTDTGRQRRFDEESKAED